MTEMIIRDYCKRTGGSYDKAPCFSLGILGTSGFYIIYQPQPLNEKVTCPFRSLPSVFSASIIEDSCRATDWIFSSLSDPDCPQITYKAKDLKQPDDHHNHNDDIEDTFDLSVHWNICIQKSQQYPDYD